MALQLLGIVMLTDGKINEAHQQLRPLTSEEMRTDLRQKLNVLSRHKLLRPATLTLFMDALLLGI